jgi:hypothetical protein
VAARSHSSRHISGILGILLTGSTCVASKGEVLCRKRHEWFGAGSTAGAAAN